ncbi:MAG: nucleotide exchange factor GrpE [Candidatus Muiribacteriota bacterium]
MDKKIFEKIEKFVKDENNISKAVDHISKNEKFEKEEKNELIKHIQGYINNIEFNQEFIDNYCTSKTIEVEKFIKEWDKNRKSFLEDIITDQVNFFSEIKRQQQYFLNVEKEVKELREFKEKAEQTIRDYAEMCARLKKDYENLSKRTEKEKAEMVENASAGICNSIIQIVDNFQHALENIKKTENPSIDKDTVISGLELVEKKIVSILSKEGVEPIVCLNQKFDHNFHEALSVEENSEVEDEIILEEFRKGYKFKEKVLRPALVKVAKNESNENGQNKEEKDK